MKFNRIIDSYTSSGEKVDIDACDYVQIELLGDHAESEDSNMLISKSCLNAVLEFSWYLGKDGYPITYSSVDGKIKMGRGLKIHQFLKGRQGRGMAIDHINRDRMDNRIENLRICTAKENTYNRTKSKNSKGKFKGVIQNANGTYSAVITKDGVRRKIDDLPDERSAAEIYDMMSEELFGEYGAKNFGE